MKRKPKTMRFAHDKGIVLRKVDDAIFLLDRIQNSIVYLNPTAYGVWRLLKQPKTKQEIIIIFAAAFPDVERKTFTSDISTVLDELWNNGLIRKL